MKGSSFRSRVDDDDDEDNQGGKKSGKGPFDPSTGSSSGDGAEGGPDGGDDHSYGQDNAENTFYDADDLDNLPGAAAAGLNKGASISSQIPPPPLRGGDRSNVRGRGSLGSGSDVSNDSDDGGSGGTGSLVSMTPLICFLHCVNTLSSSNTHSYKSMTGKRLK